MKPIADLPELPFATRLWRWRHWSLRVSLPALVVAVALSLVLMLAMLASLVMGTLDIGLAELLAILGGRAENPLYHHIVLNIRLPRAVTALFVGAALGASGAVFQSISRNALGSPDVIGFTTGSATGAIAQIVLFGGGALSVAVAAVAGGVLTAIVVYGLSVRGGQAGGYRLILTGIGVGAVLAALNNLMLVKGDLDDAVAANLWLAGSLDARTWQQAIPVALGVVVLVPLCIVGARALALMEMGDDAAAQLGVSVERQRRALLFYAVVLAALATGAAGPIAFVALAAPQLVRRLVPYTGLAVMNSALMGATLMLVGDVLTRLLPFNLTLPIGRVTGIVGGVYLIVLLARARRL
ncbi:ABC transporter permease [Saccharospirillum sp. MSK14-1]|uniref:FecCD family ABC transporter permease n=1 Tax=Saccharospirillum sp. MSK14-1 TaxID=1897632 RepID=UPI000D3ADE76|nr:iron chelate uptake ABC transporter family permease subunit [Saccharospirillum sp. MSK14-1]PTY38676.1 ABC transporter permease [Saccharospirillum sp. MSK14-1]